MKGGATGGRFKRGKTFKRMSYIRFENVSTDEFEFGRRFSNSYASKDLWHG